MWVRGQARISALWAAGGEPKIPTPGSRCTPHAGPVKGTQRDSASGRRPWGAVNPPHPQGTTLLQQCHIIALSPCSRARTKTRPLNDGRFPSAPHLVDVGRPASAGRLKCSLQGTVSILNTTLVACTYGYDEYPSDTNSTAHLFHHRLLSTEP